MTTFSIPLSRSAFRRRSYRRLAAGSASGGSRAEQGGALPRNAAAGLSRRSVYLLVALAAAVIALHIVVLIALSRPHVDEAPVERPRVPPIEIEVMRPKPLPQAAAPVPPPPPVATPQPERRTPAPARPAPSRPVQSTPVAEAPVPQAAPVSAETAPAAPAAPPVAEKVTPPRGEAGYLNNPPPKYPVVAQSRGWEGQVLLNVHVLASGRPDTVNVATSSGRKTLDDAAVKAVTEWQFVPARRGQTPIDGWVQVPIDFKLGK